MQNTQTSPKKKMTMGQILILGGFVAFFAFIGIGSYVQGSAKPVEIDAEKYKVTVDMSSYYKHTIDKGTSDTPEIEISRDYKEEVVLYPYSDTDVSSLDKLIESEQKYQDAKVLSKEEFSNGYGGKFEGRSGKYFKYYIKVGDKGFLCRAAYSNMKYQNEMIKICKSIR